MTTQPSALVVYYRVSPKEQGQSGFGLNVQRSAVAACAGGFVSEHSGMPRKPRSQALSMVDQVGDAIAKAENGDFASDTARYRQLALAALKPLTCPTEAMVDAAHEAVWFDACWAINNRRDFSRAVHAMITAAISGS